MNERKVIDGKAAALMVLLCAIWGMQQVAMKAAAPDMAPVLQVALRSAIAAALVFLVVLGRRETWALGGGTWKPGLVVGVLFALEFLFVGEGLRHTNASHMVIFLYTAPIFAALGLHFVYPEERLTPLQWLGIALAFGGVVTAFTGHGSGAGSGSGVSVGAGVGAGAGVGGSGGSGSGIGSGGGAQGAGGLMWFGDLLGLAAGMAYGATTVSIRVSRLASAPATVTLLYQLLGAFVILLAAALLMGRTHATLTPTLLTSLTFQTLIVSFASFLAWFALLRTYLASRLGVLTFMTPLYGVVFGVVLLGEKLEPGFILGALMVLAGILLVSSHELLGKGGRSAAVVTVRIRK